jgi:hypothetical protein
MNPLVLVTIKRFPIKNGKIVDTVSFPMFERVDLLDFLYSSLPTKLTNIKNSNGAAESLKLTETDINIKAL